MSTQHIFILMILNILPVVPEFTIPKGVLKTSPVSMTCKKRNNKAESIGLYKDGMQLGALKLNPLKLHTVNVPRNGQLTNSADSLTLTIAKSSCIDAGSYSCVDLSSLTLYPKNTKPLHVLDITSKPVITHSGRSTCNNQECRSCPSGTRAYVNINDSLRLSCSASVPKWGAVSAAFSWVITETGKSNDTLRSNTPRVTSTSATTTTTISGCTPNQMTKSESQYKPSERSSNNVNIICQVNYILEGKSIMTLYGKLPVCVIGGQTSATAQPVVSTTDSGNGGGPASADGGMIAGIVIGVIAVIVLIIIIVYFLWYKKKGSKDKYPASKVENNKEKPTSDNERPQGVDNPSMEDNQPSYVPQRGRQARYSTDDDGIDMRPVNNPLPPYEGSAV